MQNKQNVFINPLNIGRIIEIISQVVMIFIQIYVEFTRRVQIKSGIRTALCSVAETLQVAFQIKLERLGYLLSKNLSLLFRKDHES